MVEIYQLKCDTCGRVGGAVYGPDFNRCFACGGKFVTEKSPKMSDSLPVAKCGDCLFVEQRTPDTGGQWKCVREHSWHSAPFTRGSDWCGEFIHRRLGKQWWDEAEGAGAPVKCPPYRVWRFPTEEE